MALSPTIPTSFVPKQPVAPGSRHSSSGTNIFLYVALAILGITLILSAGVFFYAQYLTSVENAKAAELLAAQNKVSPTAVDDFVRLHNRFTAAEGIITQHIALSQFFTLLSTITVQDVSFGSLSITVADDRSAQLTLSGTAKDFNALAAESTAFAQQPDITSAIFSGITVNKDGTIGFGITATLKPDIVIEKTTGIAPALLAAPVASSASTPSLPATPSAGTIASTSTDSSNGPTNQAPPILPGSTSSTTSP